MLNESSSPVPAKYFLDPGFIFVALRPTIISTVLGSSVAVCIYDRKRKIGGMSNFQLPYIDDRKKTTARYGNVATLALIRMMLDEHSKAKHLEAQILGGSHNPEVSHKNIGRLNASTARKIMIKKRIRIISEDVGGEKGRKVVFNTHTNEIAVFKVEKLRSEDWYPYTMKR